MPEITPQSSSPPNPYDDHDAIRSLVRERFTEWSRGREGTIRTAWRNILFYRGHQWIVFDRTLNRWRPSIIRRRTPRPVTNLFASTMDAVMSVLARIEPLLTFGPGTDEAEDRAAADVAGRVIEVVEEEVGLRVQRQSLATWNGLTGGAWLETGYDPDPIHGMVPVPLEQCVQCQATQLPDQNKQCPQCGGQLFSPAVDETGAPLTQDFPRGKMYVDVVSLFELLFDLSITNWQKQRAVLRVKGVPLAEAKARWPNLAENLHVDSTSSEGQLYSESLPSLAGHIDDTATTRPLGMGQWKTLQRSQVTEEWYSQLPDSTYPEGLLAIILNRQLVAHAGPLPYRARRPDGTSTPFLNYVFFPQKLVPGSAFPKTVADDLALVAAKHNRLESLVEMILMRTANPVWLMPEGANVSQTTGEPGQIIRYNPLGPSPAKPERIPGQGLPAGLINYLDRIEQSFEELAATFEVIKGSRPEGVSAGIALQLLQERAMSRFGPMFILWSSAWAEWARQALEIFREYATEERLLRIQGRDGSWEVQKFLGADLQGHVDVAPEAVSSMPRSTMMDRAEMEQLAALGVIDIRDPEVRYKFLEAYGRTNLTPAMALDTKNAIMENEQFEALAQNTTLQALPPDEITALLTMVQMNPEGAQQALAAQGVQLPRVRPSIDDHTIHAREHRKWAKSETGQRVPFIVQMLHELHTQTHDSLALAQMQAFAVAQGNNRSAGASNPLRSGSSPSRMEGEFDEMSHRMAGRSNETTS